MVFLTYEFVAVATAFYAAYYLCRSQIIREGLLVAFGVLFLFIYGGLTSVLIVLALTLVSFYAGRVAGRTWNTAAILICAANLIVFKYTRFLLLSGVGLLLPTFATQAAGLSQQILPVAAPLGISFFTFEFIHYLVDVRHGRSPICKLRDFSAFALFWPTMVAGPIKRYEQFLPALRTGLSGPTRDDLALGLGRVAIGLVKKWFADNLTGWIAVSEVGYDAMTLDMRWIFLVAIAARILLDFSGYSDIAIGFARMLGIRVPENFNWPYLARSPAEFWQRWHMSLSSWIRDYIYIPLGGNRLGPGRRVVNGLAAMVLCGLWHGPSWNFALWGLYHGVGLAAASLLGKYRPFLRPEPGLSLWLAHRLLTSAHAAVSWSGTMLFVALGWLLFFYPVGQAARMAAGLFGY